MTSHVAIDTLVQGRIGSREVVRTMRVTHVSHFGWVAGFDPAGAIPVDVGGSQYIMPAGFEVIGPPRPEKLRIDIPAHLRDRRKVGAA